MLIVFKIAKLWPILVLMLIIGFAQGGMGDPRELKSIAIILMAAIAGGAVGGLSYSFVGRPLRRVRGVGRYLAGLASVAPYSAFIVPAIRMKEGGAYWAAWGRVEILTFWVCTVIFGLIIGQVWFGPDEPTAADKSPAGAS